MECYNCGGAHLARDCPGGAVCLFVICSEFLLKSEAEAMNFGSTCWKAKEEKQSESA